jgi:hypothetical protein
MKSLRLGRTRTLEPAAAVRWLVVGLILAVGFLAAMAIAVLMQVALCFPPLINGGAADFGGSPACVATGR